MNIDKARLRKQYKVKRKFYTDGELNVLSQSIFDKFRKSNLIAKHKTFHVFLPIETLYEVNTYPIIEYLLKMDKDVIVPKVYDENMRGCKYSDMEGLQSSRWNIKEPKVCEVIKPSQIDVVILPLLVCDIYGNRIGYGKGYYDKYLSLCSEDLLKVGLNYFEPIDHLIETYPTDVPLNYLITPNKIISF